MLVGGVVVFIVVAYGMWWMFECVFGFDVEFGCVVIVVCGE